MWQDVDYVISLVNSSKTRSEILTKMGLAPSSVYYRKLKSFEKTYNVGTSHLKEFSREANIKRRTVSNDEIFKLDSTVSQSLLRTRIRRDRLIEEKCNECDIIDTWNDKPITLQLEHINGIHNDNRLENLCWLCPNCHSQTATFCGRNITKVKKTSRKEYIDRRNQELLKQNQHLIELVKNSKIYFTRRGWSKQVATLIGKSPQKVKDWMTRYMPDQYTNAFH